MSHVTLKEVLEANPTNPTVVQVRALLESNTLVVVDARADHPGNPNDDVWYGKYQLDMDAVTLPNPALFAGGQSAVTLDLYTQVELRWDGSQFILSVVGGEISGQPASWATDTNAQHLE